MSSMGSPNASTEDCEAVITAMAAADPDLDPIWGLLVDAADARKEDEGEPSHASNEKSAEDVADDGNTVDHPCSGGRFLDGGGAALLVVPAECDQSPDASTPASSSTAPSPVAPTKSKAISAVVDKADVPPETFWLQPCSSASSVTRYDVPGCDAFVLDNVLSPEECAGLIEQGSGLWSFWDDSDRPRVTFRNAHTIEVTHNAIADAIWSRVSHLVQPMLAYNDEDDPRFEVDLEGAWVPYAVNPRLLFSKYTSGGHFSPHTDGTTVIDFNRRTFYSCVLFLNESPWGGHTRLYADEQMRKELLPDDEGRLSGDPALVLHEVPPKAGRMLVFYHRLMHEGVPAAEKFIIRTDILYRRTPEQCTALEDVEAFEMYQEAQLRAEKGECDMAAELFRKAFKRSPALKRVYRM
mmetsp:Transcript_44140/g.127387  ORF Transcript_44140/g.127387 Transcript_44140/m.127387 type:complete len:409 (-) Transcript_44140:80-1306(-)